MIPSHVALGWLRLWVNRRSHIGPMWWDDAQSKTIKIQKVLRLKGYKNKKKIKKITHQNISVLQPNKNQISKRVVTAEHLRYVYYFSLFFGVIIFH